MRILCWVIALAFLLTTTLADEQAARLGEARTALEAQPKTREGQTYGEKLGKEFIVKPLGAMKQPKPARETISESFLETHDKDGAVEEVLLHPATKTGRCANETLLKSAFSPPEQRLPTERAHELTDSASRTR